MIFKKRSYQPELMDLGHYNDDEYYDCLYKLGLIGKFLGGDRATLNAFKKLKNIHSILDVGSGGGYFAIKMGKQFPSARIVGIDIDSKAIDYAQKLMAPKNVTFEHRKSPKLDEPEFDVVTATLVLHHLDDEQLVDFLKRARKVAKRAIIINDLQRSVFAYFLFKLISPLIRNHMTVYDGLLSIKRSFTRDELITYLKLAGFNEADFTIKWCWAFRYVITINV